MRIVGAFGLLLIGCGTTGVAFPTVGSQTSCITADAGDPAVGASGSAGAVGPTGAAGPVGATGATGPQGLAGAVGAVGLSGSEGATGAMGAAGPQGPQGAQGPQGTPGAMGATGAAGAGMSKAGIYTVLSVAAPGTAAGGMNSQASCASVTDVLLTGGCLPCLSGQEYCGVSPTVTTSYPQATAAGVNVASSWNCIGTSVVGPPQEGYIQAMAVCLTAH